jgi:transketolase
MPTESRTIATEIRKDVVRMHQRGTNVGSAMSAADILAVLYFDVMNISSADDPARDRFILSKGHAASALYSVLAQKGFFDRAALADFLADGSPLTGHPSRGNLPGIEASTGSLGHGLPIAVGMGLAAKADRLTHRIFVLLGCGELQEGSVWEGAILAARLKLDNLTIIVDANNLQGYGRARDIQPIETFAPKLKAFGWAVEEVDGHDHAKLGDVLGRAPFEAEKPSAVVAHTVKGKGVAEMEDELGWHYYSVPPEKIQPFLDELDGRK